MAVSISETAQSSNENSNNLNNNNNNNKLLSTNRILKESNNFKNRLLKWFRPSNFLGEFTIIFTVNNVLHFHTLN
jgi:hypothetical protein